MTRDLTRVAVLGRRLWHTDTRLMVLALATAVALAAAALGIWLDPRLITGVPAWLKPAKFAASIGIYAVTLAWVFTYLPHWPRLRRGVSRVSVTVFVIELVIIYAQAWRGTTSHFNVGTPLDAALFAAMGAGIVLQTLASVFVVVALWRTAFTDRALGWALRLGMTLTIVGAATGGMMTRPTPAQLAGARGGQPVAIIGAHTVGAPDGGPGLPGTGWSTTDGDLRVSHFVGLHALQVLPVLVLALRRRRWSETRRVRVTLTAAASYAALFALLLSQALAGHSVVNPAGATLAMLGAWAALSAIAVALAASRRRADPAAAAVCGGAYVAQ